MGDYVLKKRFKKEYKDYEIFIYERKNHDEKEIYASLEILREISEKIKKENHSSGE